jgi:molybdopterin converting factor small subunit
MAEMINIDVSLFGAFREFDKGHPLHVTLPSGSNISALKQAIRIELEKRNPALSLKTPLEEAALASDSMILPDDYCLTQNLTLAILPPVCGG